MTRLSFGRISFQDFETLRRQVGDQVLHAGEPSARLHEALHDSHGDWIGPDAENNRDICGCRSSPVSPQSSEHVYQVKFLSFKIPRGFFRGLCITLRIQDCESKFFPLFKSQLP